jgi:hypothetical protein
MRKGLAWRAGALGLAALVRALTGRKPAAAPAPPPPDPADELRAALAESRAEEPSAPAAEPTSLEERRRQVHERAQEAIESMREPPPVA